MYTVHTALNNHAGKHLLGLKPEQNLSCSRPSQVLPIDKWAYPSIEIVEMQQKLATSAGEGIQLATCIHASLAIGIYRLDRLQQR